MPIKNFVVKNKSFKWNEMVMKEKEVKNMQSSNKNT